MPLALPAIAVVSMFIFSASWDEFPVALTMHPDKFALHTPRRFGRFHWGAHGGVGTVLRRVRDRHTAGHRRVLDISSLVPIGSVPRCNSLVIGEIAG